ncbi:MAG: radical SAM family heme chaperone HemW [Legionellales bacterium]
MLSLIPLALYIHFPWCTSKCPYCDFNSYAKTKDPIPEADYIAALKQDLKNDLEKVQGRKLVSIFMGGGTPSLFSPDHIADLLAYIHQHIGFEKNIEITLEANPESLDYEKLIGYRAAGVNRISIGVQSFNVDQLKKLGRAHNSAQAFAAITAVQKAGFTNYNIDLMYGLPKQTVEEALSDLQEALQFSPKHLSWYHLTLEPNTVFYNSPPKHLPSDSRLIEIEKNGREYLASKNLQRYEISAYARPGLHARHNCNYWEFGDYLGIGAGAHGKITHPDHIERLWKQRTPLKYLNKESNFIGGQKILNAHDLKLEFLMNGLRLINGVPKHLFSERTGLNILELESELKSLQKENLLIDGDARIQLTQQGQLFLDEILTRFV